ncbi:MAG: hypothetical protein AAB818_00405 [Patescibacteria group bacterium]
MVDSQEFGNVYFVIISLFVSDEEMNISEFLLYTTSGANEII